MEWIPVLDPIIAVLQEKSPCSRNFKAHTLLRMNFTRCAKRSVLRVSEMLVAAGLTLAIIIVLELPPRESCTQLHTGECLLETACLHCAA